MGSDTIICQKTGNGREDQMNHIKELENYIINPGKGNRDSYYTQ